MSEMFKLKYGTEILPIRIEFSDRKTLGISVLPDCSIVATAPINAADDIIKQKLKKRARWIKKQIQYFDQFLPKTPARRYLSGETHLYLGKQYRLKFCNASEASIKLKGRYFIATGPDMNSVLAKKLMNSWYLKKAEVVFKRRLLACMEKFPDLKAPKLIIKSLNKRWGSMKGAGVLTLNRDLVRAPIECIDYVLIHELCHVREPNHRTGFWNLLQRKYPGWQSAKNKLELKLK